VVLEAERQPLPKEAVLLDWVTMRTQYHSQPSAGGFDAWDVARLIELSRDLPVTRVALDSLW
jgi:hypothetical protein